MKNNLLLWMLGFGVTPEQSDKVFADPRIKMGLETKDPSGLAIDMPRALFDVGAMEAHDALNDPGEKLFLIMALRS